MPRLQAIEGGQTCCVVLGPQGSELGDLSCGLGSYKGKDRMWCTRRARLRVFAGGVVVR